MKLRRWGVIAETAVLLLAAVCLLGVLLRNEQAQPSIPIVQTFSGEYSQNGGAWQPLTEDARLSTLDGDLVLRGHLSYGAPEGGRLNFYLNHIGYSIYINGELYAMSEVMYRTENGLGLSPSMCGKWWDYILSPGITPEDELEIHLHSPHIYGNETAYRDFLNTLCNSVDSSDVLENYLEPLSRPFKIAGWAIFVMALIIVGAALAAAVLQLPIGGSLWRLGLLSITASGYMLFDTIDFSFMKGLLAFNTYGQQICMMIFVLCLEICVAQTMTSKCKWVAWAAVLFSGALDVGCFLVSLAGVMALFDTLAWWAMSQLIVTPLLAACCLLELREGTKKERLVLLIGIFLLSAVWLDIFGVGESIYSQGTCTKVVFILLFVPFVVRTAVHVVLNYQASARAKKLERELEDSRIAIMLSQIQPHFLYNSLATIEELCHSEPETAETAVRQFSDFLKGSMRALTMDKPIPFEEELTHTKNYIAIESLRFGDQLNVRFEIEAVNFKLPTLTLQPIVENAVRHGIRKSEQGGTVVISSVEYPDRFEVSVADDGAGFDPEKLPEDGRPHVGIQNVRERLRRMCGGELRITSAPGAGTRVVLILPKEGKPC